MKASALALSIALISAIGLSGNAVAHGNDWRGYDWNGHRGRVTEQHRYRHGHHRDHGHRDHYWQQAPRWSRHHRHDRHDHDNVWYGLHLFLGGY